jgi:ABC-type polysaccharide/polyol phosphate export permease
MALGFGMLLAIVNAQFRDVNYIVSVLLGLLFYASPIIYPMTLVTDLYDEHPWLRIYEYNPITSYVEAFRAVLWHLQFPGWGRLAYLAVVSLAVLVVGWTFFQRKAADVSEEL